MGVILLQYFVIYHFTFSQKRICSACLGCAGSRFVAVCTQQWIAASSGNTACYTPSHPYRCQLSRDRCVFLTHRGRRWTWRRSACRRWSRTARTGWGSAAGSPQVCGASGAQKFPARLRRRVSSGSWLRCIFGLPVWKIPWFDVHVPSGLPTICLWCLIWRFFSRKMPSDQAGVVFIDLVIWGFVSLAAQI